MIRGSATAIMVELSGASMVESATVASMASSARFSEMESPVSGPLTSSVLFDNSDRPGVAVNLQRLAVTDCRGGRAGADDGGDAVFTRDNGAVAEDTSGVTPYF